MKSTILKNVLLTVFFIAVLFASIWETSYVRAASIDNTDYPELSLNVPVLTGEAVWMVQARLEELGYEVSKNGRYDAVTNEAVKLFQLSNGLQVSGVVDEKTWIALMSNDNSKTCVTDSGETATGRKLIVIDVASRSLTLYEDYKEVVTYPVAVGKASTPSPLGEWKVIHKGVGWGNGFGSRWMGLNVPWGIYGIHGTNKPGSIGTYASHGCIRMFNSDVEKLYPLVPAGCRVKIVNDGNIIPEKITPKELKIKSSGQTVVYVQCRLKELGVEFDGADGRFGNMTELAVKYFQLWHCLEPTGTVDEETYRMMKLIE